MPSTPLRETPNQLVSLIDRYSLGLNYKVPNPLILLYIYEKIRDPYLLLYYTCVHEICVQNKAL